MDHSSLLHSSLVKPDLRGHATGWTSHIPFAIWLVQALKPKVIVELGTQQGQSYFNFCRAVIADKLETRGYAVSPWAGTDRNGLCGEAVFSEVQKHNQELYGNISSLLRMTLDEAVDYFSDGSIDLLHIDGCYTYEAVKHAFDTWLPKLTPCAIVLVHHTNARKRGFGVWRFWEELASRYPLNIEFSHSHGLGVLQLSPSENNVYLNLLDSASSERKLFIKYFESRGVDLLQQQAANDRRELAVAERDKLAIDLNKKIIARDAKITDLTQKLVDRDARIDALEHDITTLRKVEDYAATRISALLASTSWRLTAPMRALRIYSQRHLFRHTPGTLGREDSVQIVTNIAQSAFDPDFYLKLYPDVARSGLSPLDHYLNFGHNEGRLGSPPSPDIHGYLTNPRSNKPAALVVSHEASRTGAPILALNIARHLRKTHSVIALLLGGGDLVDDFKEACDVVVGPLVEPRHPQITGAVIHKLFVESPPAFAIVNSIESRVVLPSLAKLFVPTVCLVHEFAAYTRPLDAFSDAVFWASEVIFPANLVRDSAMEACPALHERETVVLPQGRSIPPKPQYSEAEYESEARRVRDIIRPDTLPPNAVVVLGAGFVQSRKGVDLFLACAARVAAMQPNNPFYFVWAGHGYDPEYDTGYSVYLRDQFHRANLENVVCFAGEFPHIELAYELSDVLFLSSRLDPLPNVVIDAAHYRLPVVCFDRSTGIADILTENGLDAPCVAPYLDVEQAAQRLVALIDSNELRRDVGETFHRIGEKVFDMESYVATLVKIATRCRAAEALEREDCALLERTDDLRVDFLRPPGAADSGRAEVIRSFVRSWARGVNLRKPLPGFHPGIYQEHRGITLGTRNPLADYIDNGRPIGPWNCEVIDPTTPALTSGSRLKVALHIHAYYSDLVSDVVRRLQDQPMDLDVFISAPSRAAGEEIRAIVRATFEAGVEVRVVPNRGRDIGPLLTEFGGLFLDSYDVIGHVHTKKTADLKDPEIGRVWGDFLLENLLGGQHSMAAKILSVMEADEGLGLVFPDDPHVWGWTDNRSIAEGLAAALDLGELPERYFWFPVGTMFWARTQALKPLWAKPWRWEDYPEEPLPYDGTLLHALERLLPFVVEKMGYRIALTNVPGISR